jgi:hypothetical protein
MALVMELDHHPVVRAAQAMGQCRIGKHRAHVPAAAIHHQHAAPRSLARLGAASLDKIAKLGVDFKQCRHVGLA